MEKKILITDCGRRICSLNGEQLYACIIYGDEPTRRELEEYENVMDYLSRNYGSDEGVCVDMSLISERVMLDAQRTKAVSCIMAALDRCGRAIELSEKTKINSLYHVTLYNKAAELRLRRTLREYGSMKRFKEAYEKWAVASLSGSGDNDSLLKAVYESLPCEKTAASWAEEKPSFKEAFSYIREAGESSADPELKAKLYEYFSKADSFADNK